jgi:hypothetical protein
MTATDDLLARADRLSDSGQVMVTASLVHDLAAALRTTETQRDALRAELAAFQSSNNINARSVIDLVAQRDAAYAVILDIDAHATPFGEDEDGHVTGGYLISVGCLHRALGKVGHSAPKCQAEAERDAAYAVIRRLLEGWAVADEWFVTTEDVDVGAKTVWYLESGIDDTDTGGTESMTPAEAEVIAHATRTRP